MPRLFTGIEIPDEQREDIARLRMPLPGGSKWVEPDNLHLTLRFAGDISNAQAAELTDRLAGISADAFELRLAGLGTFGGNEPRSLWVGVEPSPELEALARANERAARACGLAPEPRVFKPHVTVANLRFATPDAVARILGRIGAFRSEPFLGGPVRDVLGKTHHRRRAVRGRDYLHAARRRVRQLPGPRRQLVAHAARRA